MENNTLSLDKFYPQKQELILKIETTKDIVQIETKEDFLLVEEKRKEYKKIASNFKNTWLELRADATAFNKKVLSVEKELLGIVEPERDRLESLSNEYIQKLEKEKRRKSLPKRFEEIKYLYLNILAWEYNSINEVVLPEEITEDKLLELDDNNFLFFLNEIKQRLLEVQQNKLIQKQKEKDLKRTELISPYLDILEINLDTILNLDDMDFMNLVIKGKELEQDRIKKEAEEKELEDKKQKRLTLIWNYLSILEKTIDEVLSLNESDFMNLVIKGKELEQDKIKKEKEIQDKIKAIQDLWTTRARSLAMYGIFRQVQELWNMWEPDFNSLLSNAKTIYDNKIKEAADKKAKEDLEKAEADKKAKEDLEKAEAAKLEKKKIYINWLKENWYSDLNKSEFYVNVEWNKRILYKKVSEIII